MLSLKHDKTFDSSQWIDLVYDVVKIKLNNFSLLNHNFIVLCELLMPCQSFAQKCSNCQGITKISKCLWSPPEHSAIGNTMDVLQMDTHRYLNEFMHLSVSKVSQWHFKHASPLWCNDRHRHFSRIETRQCSAKSINLMRRRKLFA